MTQVSPLHALDIADRFARMHRTEDRRAMRHAAIEIACAIGLVLLAAFAGYLAHAQTTCPVQLVDFN